MKASRINTRTITSIAIFSAISILLYTVPFLQFKIIGIFPDFLEFHFDEVPIFIAGFAFGPLPALLITFIKTLIKLPLTSTAGVGELADFIYTSAFVLPAALFYKRHKTFKGVLIAFTIGFFCQVIVSALCNSLFMINFYIDLFNISEEILLASVHAVNPKITDLKITLIIWGIIPFNVIKNLFVIIMTVLVYKRINFLINKH